MIKSRSNTNRLICLLFTAEWCGSCQSLDPVWARIQQEFEGKMQFTKIDIDKTPPSDSRFDIYSVPTLILSKNDEEIRRTAGLLTTYELRAVVKRYLKPGKE